jgi:hypothetical protein
VALDRSSDQGRHFGADDTAQYPIEQTHDFLRTLFHL